MDEVRIGCYGLNGHQIHGQVASLGRARLTACAGIEPGAWGDLRAQHAETFAAVRRFESLEEMLADGEVDLVSLCSPRRAEQARHAVQCLSAGRHVLAEKAMATTRADLDRLREAAAASGRRLWTMTSMVYYPAVRGAKAVVDSGRLGRIVQVGMMKSYPYHAGRPQDRDVDGGIMQAGIHAFSIIGHVTGQGFAEIFAQDTGAGNPGDGALQMAATVACRLDEGALASVVCNYCNPPKIGYWGNDQLCIHGTAGMLELVDGFTRRRLTVGDEPPGTFEDDPAPPAYPQDMIDAILDGTPTLLSVEAGFAYTEAAIRAQESMQRGAPIGRP